MTRIYINLTNGIEAIPELGTYHFIRIQSTACEQKRWDFILQDLDTDLLMNLTLGNECLIYDFGHQGTPRALWQGVEFIRYVLSKLWLNQEIKPIMRGGHNAAGYFATIYARLEDRTFKKLEYFRKFLQTDQIRLVPTGWITRHDSDYAWYKKLLDSRKDQVLPSGS